MKKRTFVIVAAVASSICILMSINHGVDARASAVAIKGRGQITYDADGDNNYTGAEDVYITYDDIKYLEKRLETLTVEVEDLRNKSK